jgi:hypothetical protein
MNRRTWAAVVAAVASLVAAIVLYVDNRRLEREVGELRAAAAAPAPANDPWAASDEPAEPADRAVAGIPRGLGGAIDGADAPQLVDAPKESRLERRMRRQDELTALLGRLDGETEEEYRARLLPLLEMALSGPRDRLAEQRRAAEAAAGVTEEQSKKLDAVFEETYDELITYTNAAVQDGQLTPYERNVSGMLEYAGGLGAILGGAETKIGGVLTPGQVDTIYGSGFEWAEYLGVSAPWEKIQPPPPPPGGS